jgi:flagellar biosynthesis protein FlhF
MRRKASPPANHKPGVLVFEGPSIFEAYSKLKRKLGEDAVILSTRSIKRGGILGFWGQKVIQITASTDSNTKSRLKNKPQQPTTKSAPPQEKNPSSSEDTTTSMMVEFKKELSDIRAMIQDIQTHTNTRSWPELPREFQKAYERLQRYNISDDIARALIHRWQSHYPNFKSGQKANVQLLERYIGKMLVPAGPIRIKNNGPTVVMLVGPTGVGKTTSIAKLAAQFKIREHRRVALITIDTYRIAAVEQLKTYADLIGVPLKVVDDQKALKKAVQSFHDRDLILVDSAGRSPRSKEKMDELHGYVKAAAPDELHLVCSVSVNNDVLKDTLERYQNFPVTKLMLTKLDEAVHYGVILSIISKTQKPIGYLTTGQEVPDDLEVASQDRLSRLILKLDEIHA